MMMELRYIQRFEPVPETDYGHMVKVLQYRDRRRLKMPKTSAELQALALIEAESGIEVTEWSEWRDVPTVKD